MKRVLRCKSETTRLYRSATMKLSLRLNWSQDHRDKMGEIIDDGV